MEVEHHAFLTSALDGGKWSALLSALNPGMVMRFILKLVDSFVIQFVCLFVFAVIIVTG
jgi:hypothetical protein